MPDVLKKKNLVITEDYIAGFKRADNTFKYQIVFDPLTKKQVSLNPYQDVITKEELTYAGL
jgi:exonuclease-1